MTRTMIGRLISMVAILAAASLVHLPAAAQANLRAIGAVIAPPELIALYSCTTYGEAVFLPKVQVRAKQLAQNASDKQVLLKRTLSQYDNLLNAMCRETISVFQQHRALVLDIYARQLPGNQSDIAPLLANPRGNRWASENSAFLGATAPLFQYHALVKSVAPQLLKHSGTYLDPIAAAEIKSASAGMLAQGERARLISILADDGFVGLVPSRFDLPSLQKDEVRLRREAASLTYATVFPWFNDNASDLVRMHFNGFDVMRNLGLADVYLIYGQKLDEMLRQN